jgi:hypothetical protein
MNPRYQLMQRVHNAFPGWVQIEPAMPAGDIAALIAAGKIVRRGQYLGLAHFANLRRAEH